jgi:hypothetical protein
MAEQKKSFVLYGDLIHTTQHLTNEDAGKVFKWVLEYVNDNHPEPLKGLLAAVCEPIKQQLKRDLLKYESKREQYSEAGKKSAEARRLKKLKEKELKKDSQRTLTNVESRSTNSTVTVNDSVNVSVTVNDIINREADFKKSLQPFLEKYGANLLNEFYLYWTEKNAKGKKMKFEMNKTFDVSRRLSRWSNNNFNTNKNGKQEKQKQLREFISNSGSNNPNV